MSSISTIGDDATTLFRFGEFTFDSGSHLLLRNGVQQRLSPKAQQLLLLLLQAWPSARSREDLYDALWPATFVCETNMAGIVSELRRALGDDARASQYIRTVHGFGYAFCGEVVSWTRETNVAATLYCEGQRYPLVEGQNCVGRTPDCRVVLANVTVSRRHAVITVRGDEVWLEDLDSMNGTYVDMKKIKTARVDAKSLIAFGGVEATIIPRQLSSTKSLQLDMQAMNRVLAQRAVEAPPTGEL